MGTEISPLGDGALLVDFGTEAHDRALALWRRLKAFPPPWCAEAVLGDGALVLHLAGKPEGWAGLLEAPPAGAPEPRLFEIGVRYDGEDLEAVAGLKGLSTLEVIALHSGAEYRVLFLGFLPGFPYLHGLPEALRTPRLERPRLRVPAGSVAIADDRCGIYPRESPGGWRLLGRTDTALFDPRRDPPARLAPGDRVRFVPA